LRKQEGSLPAKSRLEAESWKLEAVLRFWGWSRMAGAPGSNEQYKLRKGCRDFYGEGKI
jgi:hypothetical protein